VPFQFNGTLTASQFERFRTYLRNQVKLIDARIQHLQAERSRVGDLLFAYDSGGIPTGMSNDPPQTYCGKLFGAYEALGGDADFDLQVRSTDQPVFKLTGDAAQLSQLNSNGEVVGVGGLSDAASASIMQKLRGWTAGDLHYRRGALERKIRRAIDYAEQLDAEVSELQLMKASVDVEGSLEFMVSTMESFASDRRYMPVTNDANTDPHGKFARAPVASYMPGGGGKGTTSTSYQRTVDGLVKPEA
jgi:hypothetical protein